MPHFFRTTSVRFGALVTTAALLAACGGGGGGSSTPRPPAPSPSPTSTGTVTTTQCAAIAIPSGVTPSKFTITANSPVTVSLDGAVVGTTPVTVTPAQCTPSSQYPGGAPHTITWNAATPYSVQIQQTNNGDHTLYYNGAEDTGTITAGPAALSAGRSVQAAAAPRVAAAVIRRPLQRSFRTNDIVANRFYVTVRDTGETLARVRDFEARSAANAVDLGTLRAGVRSRVISVAPGQSLQTAMNAYRGVQGVVDVQPVHVRRAQGVRTPATVTAQTVSDPLFDNVDQWDLFAIDTAHAWSYNNGASATVAIIDTGVDPANPDIGGKIAYAETVLSGKVTVGPTNDDDGHGTNVAGIAGAATNNGQGFAGVGYNVGIQAYKVIPASGNGDTADEAQAINDAVAHGANVINLSLGGSEFDAAENAAVENAISKGVVVVAAAGNCGDPAASGCTQGATNVLDYPAAYDGVISVGASAYNDNNTNTFTGTGATTEFIPLYSQSAPALSLVAPGGGSISGAGNVTDGSDSDTLHWIYNLYSSTGQPDPTTHKVCSTPPLCKALFVGTSQATPHVAGAAALVDSWLIAHGQAALSPARMAQLLESTADDIGAGSRQGHGRLNVYRALAAVSGDASPPQYTPADNQFVAFAYANSGSNVPAILDVNYPHGAPVAADGTFRIADVSPVPIGSRPGAGSYRVAVWYDANGNGVIDAGDEIAVGSQSCATSSKCFPGAFTIKRVSAGYTLP